MKCKYCNDEECDEETICEKALMIEEEGSLHSYYKHTWRQYDDQDAPLVDEPIIVLCENEGVEWLEKDSAVKEYRKAWMPVSELIQLSKQIYIDRY